MKAITYIFYCVIAVTLSILAFYAMREMLVAVPNGQAAETSFENIVVILLTTVTVLFTLAALLFAILGFFGQRAIKKEVGSIAAAAVLTAVEETLKDGGTASKMMEAKLPPHEGPIRDWMQELIERQVISLLPLIMDRVNLSSSIGPVDPDEPEDEGNPE